MSDIKHSEREHSLFSPSSYERWSRCPASALFTADIPREDNEHSLRGTWCHEQVERLFRGEEIDTESDFWKITNVEQIEFAYEYAKQLIEHCSVMEPADVFHETKVVMLNNKDVFGTADLVIYDKEEKRLWVIDYKFGYTTVPAKQNKQLMMYAVLAKESLVPYMPVKDYILMVIQPPNVRQMVDKDLITSAELATFALNGLQPALNAARKGDADFNPGEKQCKWCPASGQCPAQRDSALEIFDEFDTKREDSFDYGRLLPLVAEMQEFINGVYKAARRQALNGTPVPGHKLVQKVTRSKWRDKEKAEKWLTLRKIPKEQRTQTEVIPLGKAKKIVLPMIKDNPILQKNFEKLIEKPKGELVLVPDDDPRPPVETENPLMEDDLI